MRLLWQHTHSTTQAWRGIISNGLFASHVNFCVQVDTPQKMKKILDGVGAALDAQDKLQQ